MSDKPTHLPDLSEFLAPDLKEAIQSYHLFKKEKMPADAKGFTAYHNACKSALMHIALLLKLIQAIPRETETSTTSPDWIQQAQTALKGELSFYPESIKDTENNFYQETFDTPIKNKTAEKGDDDVDDEDDDLFFD